MNMESSNFDEGRYRYLRTYGTYGKFVKHLIYIGKLW